jgi:alanine racemase
VPQRALASVNLAAIERNVSRLRSGLSGATALCAVVKADGYGHGALPAARAALAGGASMLGVATAREAADLRAREIDAPILVMGAISRDELPIALRSGAEIVAWNERFVETLLVTRAGAGDSLAPTAIHVKLDSGLGRLGTRDRSEALAVAERVAAARGALTLTGAMTHFATADEELEFTRLQLERFERFLAELRARHPRLIVHAANSAATLREPASHFDMVRCGIAVYGGDPMNEDPDHHALEPAMELSSYVAAVKLARAGDSTGYGRRFVADRDTWIATLPIGYGDGIRRALSNNCDVLIGGRRYPLVGTVSMDNLTVDLGAAPAVSVGDRAIIIGRDGGLHQTAEDLARRIATINYEILCGVSSRVPRSYHHDGQPAS